MREFRGKIEFLSTRNLICRKFAGVCRNNATFAPPTFSQPTTPLRETIQIYEITQIRTYFNQTLK